MNPSTSANLRPASDDAAAVGSMHQSASFAEHLKTLERKIPLRARYENYIGGRWVAPAKSGYFDNISPITGQVVCQVAVVPDDLENMYAGCIDGVCLFDPWD